MNTDQTCPDCGTPLQPYGVTRGLCRPCYFRRRRAGTHIDAPTTYRSRADVLDDYRLLRGEGLTRRQAAARMGMRKATLDWALWKAKRDGAAA